MQDEEREETSRQPLHLSCTSDLKRCDLIVREQPSRTASTRFNHRFWCGENIPCDQFLRGSPEGRAAGTAETPEDAAAAGRGARGGGLHRQVVTQTSNCESVTGVTWGGGLMFHLLKLVETSCMSSKDWVKGLVYGWPQMGGHQVSQEKRERDSRHSIFHLL